MKAKVGNVGSWSEMSLKDDLRLFLGKGVRRRIVVVGVGNPMRGDDKVGMLIVDLLKKKKKDNVSLKNVLLIKTGSVPENFTGKIRRFDPTHVLIIDAAEMGGEPGEARLLSIETIEGVSISTHNLPLNLLAGFIERMTGAKVAVIGVQPKETEFGARISIALKEAALRISKIIYEIIINTNL
ncbi:hydrogenase maturation peptidase HycI [Candidatus Bathyarchaeota archaeon]|nr:hydrogenase maturation peptidase HycI [Candidatus Bathyarchaeota archaeon]